MKLIFELLIAISITLCFQACKSSQKIDSVHNSQNSLDWSGIYKGKILLDEKENILIIQLNNDLTYLMETATTNNYENRKISNGKFKWNETGSEIVLKDDANNKFASYKVGENILIKTGDNSVSLKKINNGEITNKYWKLIEINGEPIVYDENMRKEPHLILNSENNRFHGNGGCNGISGTFELPNTLRIKFSQPISTMMACTNMEIEKKLLNVLEMTDNYTLSEDGRILSLNRARMAPLARFEVVYLR